MRRLAPRAMLECFPICRRFRPMSSFCTRLVAQAESAIVGTSMTLLTPWGTPLLVGLSSANLWLTILRLTGPSCGLMPIHRNCATRAARNSILNACTAMGRPAIRSSTSVTIRRSSYWAWTEQMCRAKCRGHCSHRRPAQRFAHAHVATASRHAQGPQRVCG